MKKLLDILKHINEHPLARKQKIRTFYRIFIWQLSQFISPKLVVRKFIGDTKLFAKKGMAAATANIYFGLHEFNEMGFLLHFLRPEDVFVDVGANIGSYTILASGVIGARTISIEPIPETFNLMGKNILLNNLQEKVCALNIGIGSKDESLYFTKNQDSTNRVVLNNDNTNYSDLIKVPVKSLNQLLASEQCPVLMKIDVEGFEQEVVNGASIALKNNNLKAIIIELNGGGKNYGFDEENIHRLLLNYEFSPYTYHPLERRLEKLSTHGPNNTIYLRDDDFVNERLITAKKINVFSKIF